MKSLTIEIPKGYQIDTFDKQTGKVTFAPIPKVVAGMTLEHPYEETRIPEYPHKGRNPLPYWPNIRREK